MLSQGCTQVRLIAEYDDLLDQGITALQKKSEDHFSRLEKKMARMAQLKPHAPEMKNLKKEVAYAASEEFYRTFRVDLRVLQARADAYADNELTVRQLAALEELLDMQEEIHCKGFSGVDDVMDMRRAFERSFKAILKLEIAKKRGQ